jgi:ParB/RepB/Spo0J family partition protein
MSEQIQKIPLNEIYVDEEFNCRDSINPVEVVDLAKSIAKDGLIQPIVVTTIKEPIEDYKYKVVAGFRRLFAHRVNKAETIDCIVRADLDEKAARILNLTENLSRHNLTILEEAKSILPLFKLGLNEYQIADELPSASRGWVQVRVMLLKLPVEVQKEAAAGLLSQTQIRDLYTLKNNGATDEQLYEHVKIIKDNKIKHSGIGKHIPRKMPPAQSKRLRKRQEMFALIDHILEHLGNSFGARCVSWCAGEISDLDIFQDIKNEAMKNGKDYTIPSQSL